MVAGILLESDKDPLGLRPKGMQVAYSDQTAHIEADRDIDGLQGRVTKSGQPICISIRLIKRAVIKMTWTLERGAPDFDITLTSKAQYVDSAEAIGTQAKRKPVSTSTVVRITGIVAPGLFVVEAKQLTVELRPRCGPTICLSHRQRQHCISDTRA